MYIHVVTHFVCMCRMEFESEIPGHKLPVNEMSLFAEMSGTGGDTFSGTYAEYFCVCS